MTKWKSLASVSDYRAALARINELMDTKRTDAVHNELNLLSFLVEVYEEEFHSLPDASPLEVIRFAMDMKGIKQQDLIPILGTKGNVSKVLSGKANLQLVDIQPLSVLLGIPIDALIPKNEMYNESIEVLAEPVIEYKLPKRISKSEAKEPLRTNKYLAKSRRPLRAAAKKSAR